MAGKITIDTERCKGCGLCVSVCPRSCIVISKKSNKSGYFPAKFEGNNCSVCASCAIMCPEAIIEVYTEDSIVAIGQRKQKKPSFSKSKK